MESVVTFLQDVVPQVRVLTITRVCFLNVWS